MKVVIVGAGPAGLITALLKARHILMKFSNKDLANIGKFLSGLKQGEGRSPKIRKIAKYPSLLLKLDKLRTIYKAGRITTAYGW